MHDCKIDHTAAILAETMVLVDMEADDAASLRAQVAASRGVLLAIYETMRGASHHNCATCTNIAPVLARYFGH